MRSPEHLILALVRGHGDLASFDLRIFSIAPNFTEMCIHFREGNLILTSAYFFSLIVQKCFNPILISSFIHNKILCDIVHQTVKKSKFILRRDFEKKFSTVKFHPFQFCLDIFGSYQSPIFQEQSQAHVPLILPRYQTKAVDFD